MSNKNQFICTVCPVGCSVTVEEDSGSYSVSGNSCKRGEKYAVEELTDPRRTVTSTVKTADGRMVSVKTKTPVPKRFIIDIVKIIKQQGTAEIERLISSGGADIGSILIPNILDTGVDVVLTSAI